MKSVFLELKTFFKHRVWGGLYLAFCLGVVILLICEFQRYIMFENPYPDIFVYEKACGGYMFPYLMRYTKIPFYLFLPLSFEFYYVARRDGLREVIASSRRGSFANGMARLAAFSLLALLLCVLCYGVCCAYCLRLGFLTAEHLPYFLYFVRAICLYIFLPCVLAVLLGWLCSLFSYKLMGYAALFGSVYLFSEYFAEQLRVMYVTAGNEIYLSCSKLVSVFLTGADYYALDSGYLYSAEAVNFQKTGFWLFGILAVLILFLARRRMKAMALPVFVASAACLYFAVQPTAAYYMVLDGIDAWGTGSWTADQEYYEKAAVWEQEYEDPDFTVTEYDMELEIKRLLSARVSVKLEGAEGKTLKFTLYHGYRITSLEDGDGRPLEYDVDTDFVTVHNPDGRKIEELHFAYEGSSPMFYSTSQGLYLPGYFEYYPKPGMVEVFFEAGGYNGFVSDREEKKTEALYRVTVDTKEKVYSNLEETGRNAFAGKATSLILFAGMDVREVTKGDIRFVYPYGSDYDYDSFWGEITERIDEMEADKDNAVSYTMHGKTVFIPGAAFLAGARYFSEDYCTGIGMTTFFLPSSGYKSYLESGLYYPDLAEDNPEESLEALEELEELMNESEEQEGE